ncbi:hypothetical protein GCM10020367_21670 [Streptomyces sannanensis]|uniref:Uncharacterized protein n=1 Tax=Streptomyces sannanensis TaxID=285536 RepID=A0ABP6S9J9_9ACTN
MPPGIVSEVSRWDQHGREHKVRVRKSDLRRSLACGETRFSAPLPRAEAHPVETHRATVAPGGR